MLPRMHHLSSAAEMYRAFTELGAVWQTVGDHANRSDISAHGNELLSLAAPLQHALHASLNRTAAAGVGGGKCWANVGEEGCGGFRPRNPSPHPHPATSCCCRYSRPRILTLAVPLMSSSQTQTLTPSELSPSPCDEPPPPLLLQVKEVETTTTLLASIQSSRPEVVAAYQSLLASPELTFGRLDGPAHAFHR